MSGRDNTSLETLAEASCTLCKVVANELPSYKVYEDDKYLGILDIYPNSEYFPKRKYFNS